MKAESAWCRRLVLALVLASTCFVVANHVFGQSQQNTQSAAAAASTQKSFRSPKEAAEALIQAAQRYDEPALLDIFGPDGKDLVSSEDPVQDRNRAEAFVAKAREKNTVTIDPKNRQRATLSVGNDDWPLPVPIVKRTGKWYYDSKAGRNEILFRRVGANELDAIQVCRGFVEAQKEYASYIHDNSGGNQYAQKIISTPGKHDGLYWRNPDGSSGGPIGEAVAKALEEGYSANEGSGYHGYYFKILKGQGPAAPLGALDYVIDGIMIGGFALLAAPAEYGVTGVKTFMVSHTGIVYEKDLGAHTLNTAKTIERYNPDSTWHRTNDQWPDETTEARD
jgi:Protein of unknown function (DUF2950)